MKTKWYYYIDTFFDGQKVIFKIRKRRKTIIGQIHKTLISGLTFDEAKKLIKNPYMLEQKYLRKMYSFYHIIGIGIIITAVICYLLTQ